MIFISGRLRSHRLLRLGFSLLLALISTLALRSFTLLYLSNRLLLLLSLHCLKLCLSFFLSLGLRLGPSQRFLRSLFGLDSRLLSFTSLKLRLVRSPLQRHLLLVLKSPVLSPLELLGGQIMLFFALLDELCPDLVLLLLLDFVFLLLTCNPLLGSLDKSPLAVTEIVRKANSQDVLITRGVDLDTDFVVASLKLKLNVDGASHAVRRLASHNIVRMASLVKTESQLEPILALETSEVAVIELSKNKNNGTSLGKGEGEVRVVVVQSPRDSQCSPQLADSPIRCEETGSLEGLILLKKVFVRDPEISIVPEAMVELLKPLGRPLLRAIAWTAAITSDTDGVQRTLSRISERLLKDNKRDTHEIVNNLGNPRAITVKDKAVDTHILIMSNTELLDQASLFTERAQSSHEPAVSVTSLSNIIGSCAVNVEARLVKDVTNTLYTLRRKIHTGLVALYVG
ncbi:hypothetical protein HG530_005809 [Fusarium avenaceum]|nr:hypothetical protein HG530_005809 [Fusarium avenaceum]